MSEYIESQRQISGSGTPNRVQSVPTIKDVPIMREYGRLGDSLSSLEEAVSYLEQRLQPVLTPIPVEASGAKGDPEPAQSKLADSIRSEANRVFNLRDRISYLLANLELE